jgi:adenosylcobinamide-GDP ribazoletransferase
MRLALSLLTVIPVRAPARPLGSAAAWFPLVGAAIGGAAGAVAVAADHLFGRGIAAVLAVAVLVALTGALHLDGLADSADAIGVRGGRERRLAVMRESTIGTFGTLALVVWALLLATSVAALPGDDALAALAVAAACGRWAALLHARLAAPARTDGLGAAFVVTPAVLCIATAISAAGALLLERAEGIAALAAAAGVALAVSVAARRGLGGRTGDTLGATVVLAELAALLTLVAVLR